MGSSISRLGLLFLLLISIQVRADHCADSLSQTDLKSSEARPLKFTGVEVYRRNNNVGQQQVGDLVLEKWIEISQTDTGTESFLGLTKDQRIYHIVQWKNRRIARLLSGTQTFQDIYVYKGEVLLAINQDQRVHLFSPSLWMRKPIRSLLKLGSLTWAATAGIGLGAIHLGAPEALSSAENIVMIGGLMVSASALSSFLGMTHFYEHQNTYPNGFLPTETRFLNKEQLAQSLSELDQKQTEHFLAKQHFAPPDLKSLFPPLPEFAVEEIR